MVGTIANSGLSDAPLFPLDGTAKLILGLLSPYIGAVFMETWLYGIYTILFGICIFVLLRRHKSLHWVLLLFAILMYALASADIGYTYYLVFGKLLEGNLSFRSLYPKYVLFVTNGVLADTLLMYRCFVVWGRKKRIIFGPFLLLLATTVSGYLFEGASANLFRHAWVYLAMTFALNVILTILTAGRIWHLRHRTQTLLGEGLLQRYNATLTILIESGVLYSIYMVLDLAFQNDPVASTILDAGLIQVVGIMPTLIIVQVGLGRAMHDMDQPNGTTTSAIAIDPLGRIEANKASASAFPNPKGAHQTSSSFVAVPNGRGGYGYYGPGYFRSSDNDDAEDSRSSKALSTTSFNPYAMRSAGVLSEATATATVDSRSELVLHITKPKAKTTAATPSRPGWGSASTAVSVVPEVLRVDSWGSKHKKGVASDASVAMDAADNAKYTPAPQRRRSRKGSARSQRSFAHGPTPTAHLGPKPSFDAGYTYGVGSHNAHGSYSSPLAQEYRYPTGADSDEEGEEQEGGDLQRSFSMSKRTLVYDNDGDNYASEPYPRPHNPENGPLSPTATSPLLSTMPPTPPAPTQQPYQSHRRQHSTPPPPGITFPFPSFSAPSSMLPKPNPKPRKTVGTATGTSLPVTTSPLSRLVNDIARPQPAAPPPQAAAGAVGGYFDSSLSAAWGNPRWTGTPGRGVRSEHGESGVQRTPSSAFPVPVSPSRASSINESCYSPI